MSRTYLSQSELMVLLAVMRLRDEAYGVPISAEIARHTTREMAAGAVYATLERLEDRGLVASEIGEPSATRGGRAKTYFKVTAQGVRLVRESQQALQRLWNGLPELRGKGA